MEYNVYILPLSNVYSPLFTGGCIMVYSPFLNFYRFYGEMLQMIFPTSCA